MADSTPLTEYSIQITFKESGADSTAKSIDHVTTSTQKLKSVIKSLGIGAALKSLLGKIRDCTLETSNYIETMNYFSASMGDASEKAKEFVKNAEDMLGLDPKNLMDSISGFKNLADGFGVSSDKAYLMSQNLTQLAGDLSSFANISFEDAQRKLMSGFSGQVKPLREYGIALNQASLQETAYSLGLQQRVQDMTMAQKSELIYYQIMTSTTKMQGDLARTLDSPANALRVMRNEFNKLAREVGAVFIPIMMKIIPVVIAVTEIILDAVKAIAGFFHINIGDYSADTENIGNLLQNVGGGIEDIGSAAEDTTKKMNKMLMPFDELNNITSSTGTGGGIGGVGGFGGDLGIDLPEYNMFENVSKKIREEVDKIKAKIKELAPIILGVGIALLAVWGILKFAKRAKELKDFSGGLVSLKTGLNNLMTSLGKSAMIISILGGLALVIESVTHLIEAFSESGLSLTDTLILIGGTVLIVVAAFAALWLMMKHFDPSIKSIAGAIVIFVGLALVLSQLDDIVVALGESELELTDLFGGLAAIMLSVAALAAILVALGTALQSPMAMAGVLIVTLAIVAVLFTLSETLPYILDAISIFIEDIGPTVIQIIDKIGEVIERIIEKIGVVLPPIIESLGKTFDTIFNGISRVVETVGNTVSKIVETMGNSITTVLNGVRGVIKQIGDTIQTVAQTIIWFIDNLGPAISNFTSSLITSTTRIVNFVISAIEYLVNRVVDGTNSLAEAANKVPGVNIQKSSHIKIPRFYGYAQGGFPETGQLFIANEAGPELIGNIGNRTAVANKDQITTAIANATYQAMSRALAENGQNDGQPIIVNVGNEQLYKGMANYKNQQSNMYGINV